MISIEAKTEGLIAAVFTPFDPRGRLALCRIAEYASFLIDNRLQGVFVAGTTGESLSLRSEERKELADAWIRSAKGRLRVIVHVGHNCLDEAQELAEHAQNIGADAVSAMPPCFFRPQNLEDLVGWCAAIAQASPKVPFYYYHIPSMTGVQIAVPEFIRQAKETIPNFAGVKFTHEDLAEYQRAVETDKRLDILFGRDELLLSGLQAGAYGAVGSTYNFAAPLYQALIQAYRQSDLIRAQQLQQEACRMIDLCREAGGHILAAFKALMAWVGVDCGPARPPLRNLSIQQKERLIHTLAQTLPENRWSRPNQKTTMLAE
ncbi:MAG: dihydrodipicolinate synthase family protein [Thermoguttaceae bacterium]|nr:dihydrodipicolinate synthase family protein [Thermoguttaceae bacterium]MDW8037176.1 dihydrodipicolinate synthase family protein [Thermoguttaceae bacterium]